MIGLLSSSFSLASMIFAPLLGSLSDKILKRKRFLVVGSLIPLSRCTLGYRARYIKSIARDVTMGRAPTMKELETMTPQGAKEELMKLSGIGEYSAGIISPHPSFPLDVWSVKIFAEIFDLEIGERPREEIPRVKRYAREAFGEWRHYVFLYVLHDLENLGLKPE